MNVALGQIRLVCLMLCVDGNPSPDKYISAYNSGTDKLGMDIFSQLEPVFRNEVSNFFSKKYVAHIRTIIFQKIFFLISSSLIEICRVN